MQTTGTPIEQVAGFDVLSAPARELFTATAARHRAAVGTAYKGSVRPIRVREYRDHLKVWLARGDWTRYLPDGTWG